MKCGGNSPAKTLLAKRGAPPIIRTMKTHCPKCGAGFDVEEIAILRQIERSPKLRTKVASLLGRLTGGQTKLDARGRRERAKKAVQAREAKRSARVTGKCA